MTIGSPSIAGRAGPGDEEPRFRSGDAPAAESRGRGIRPIWLVLQAVVAVAFVATLVVVLVHHPESSRPSRLYEYTVPPGTSLKIEQGQKLYVFPAHLVVHVRDSLVIHNDDTTVVEVGPYTVARNSTLVQTFTSPGTIVGICTIHPSGRVEIDVER